MPRERSHMYRGLFESGVVSTPVGSGKPSAQNPRTSLVDGTLRQRFEGTGNLLDIPLITGERLEFDGDAKKFSVG